MSMKDDYVWDRSGPPDPDVQRLERLLGQLQSVPPVPQLPETFVRGHRLRVFAPVLAAAAAIVFMVAGTWQSTRLPASWEIASLSGQPRVGSTVIGGRGRLAVGATLITDSASQA